MREITKTVLVFVIGFIGVLVLSAFLAPWLFTFLPFKFDRILRRCIMVGTLLLVGWVVWRRRRETVGRFGLEWSPARGRLLGRGFLAGLAIVALMTGLQWALGARLWRLDESGLGQWLGFLFKGLGAGILIGMIEEFFFRGFLFLTFKDLWNTPGSLFATNLIYALTHFFPKGKVLVEGAPTAWDSFRIYAAMFSPAWQAPEKLLGLAGLFLFGLILSFVFLRAGSLYPSIGIHAGAVFGLKTNGRFLSEVSEKFSLWSGGKALYDGIAGLVVLGLLTFLAGRGCNRLEDSRASR
jgi:hypothetical protein